MKKKDVTRVGNITDEACSKSLIVQCLKAQPIHLTIFLKS
jgi:hypothetical protein